MMLFGLSSMLDSGQYDNITFQDVKRHSHDGDLIPFLKERAGGFFASNIFDAHPNFSKWFTEEIAKNCIRMHNNERRKYGVQQRGLCLLVSYTAEILQSSKVPLSLR
jgi:hypothetical protein